MPTKKAPKASVLKKTTPKETRAKIAFEEYKKRMKSSNAARDMDAEFNPAQPFNPLKFGGVPPWPYLPPSATMSPPYLQQSPMHGIADKFQGSSKSLFEGIGNMLARGVDLLNAGMLGGRQILEGFSGVGHDISGSVWHGYHHHHAYDYCCEAGYPYGSCCDCFYEPCCCCECCNPSVHNCR